MLCKVFLVIALLCRIAMSAYYEELYEKLKQRLTVSGEATVDWEFGKNAYLLGKSEENLKMLAAAKTSKKSNLAPRVFSKAELSEPLPTHFDARQRWPNCSTIKFIKDQSNCGSCWAVSAASVMSDRYCIQNRTTQMKFISEEELISCCRSCGLGCDGGFPDKAFVYWATRGIPTGGPYQQVACKPYSIKPCRGCLKTAPTPSCEKKCNSEYNTSLSADRSFGSEAYALTDETSIMLELYLNGPVVATFTVYSDFFYYRRGVYQHSMWSNIVGYHAVRIIGWGVENGVPYWIIANSWSKDFGQDGLFWMRRGQNECEIEKQCVASNPV